jgi:glycosyltransferase involved in cell wall biosynthesis
LIRDIGPNVVHIQYHGDDFGRGPWINLLPIMLKMSGKRVITTLHNLNGPPYFERFWLWLLLKTTNRVILTNERDMEKLVRNFSSVRKKATIIPAGPGTPKIGKGEKRKNGPIVISYYGFINPQKGIETLFFALRGVIDSGYKVRLLMIGDLHSGVGNGLGEYRRRIRELARELGIEGSIHWRGYVGKDEASSLLLSSDICVLPFADGASTKRSSLISCLSHGVPVITTLDGTPPDGMEDHKNILFFPPGNVDILKKAIIELIKDRGLRKRLGREGERLVEERYSWKRIVEATKCLY